MSATEANIGIRLSLRGDRDVQGGVKRVTQSVNDLGGSAKAISSTLVNMLGATLGAGTIAAFTSKLVSVQRQFDVLNSSLITVTGSSAQAQKEFDWIRQFASETPFALQEVTQAFVKMKAFGLDATKGALESYGNTASAMGTSLEQMIEAVADAATGEFERLKAFGIRASQQGDQVTFTFRGVSTTVKKSSDEIVAYLKRIGDVDFAGAAVERAKTLDGALSNLADSWDRLFLAVSNAGAGEVAKKSALGASGALLTLAESLEIATKKGVGFWDALAAVGQRDQVKSQLDYANSRIADLNKRLLNGGDSKELRSRIVDMQNYIDKLKELQQEDLKLRGQAAGGGRGFTSPQTAAQLQEVEDKRSAAQKDAYDKLMLRLATPSEKLKDELAKQREALGPLFTADVEKRIRSSFDKGGSKNKVTAADLLAVDVAEIQRTLGRYTSAYTNAQELVAAAQEAGLLSDREFYESRLAFINLNADAKLDALQQERDRLERETSAGPERLQRLKRVADIEAEIGAVRQDVATQTRVLEIREESRIKKLLDGYTEANAAAQAYLGTLNVQYARELEAVGKGDRERRRMAELNQIDDRYEGQRQSLAGERRRGEITEDQYRQQLAIVDKYNRLAVESTRRKFADIEAANANWVNGASEALANYRDSAADVAGMTKSLVTDSFQGMEDALVSFATTGKLSFSSLANSIVADITRIIIKQQISNALGVAGGAGGLLGLLGSGIGALFGTTGKVAAASAMSGNSMDNLMGLTGGFGTMSFDGGGYTGNGPRAGGVDGKGGFWALMHPRETVTDHTQPGGGRAGASVVVHLTNQFNGPADRAQVLTAAQLGASLAERNIRDQLSRGRL